MAIRAVHSLLRSKRTQITAGDGTQLEALRRTFRPKQVRMLFVGESRPASGRFFYRRDSGLYRAIRQLFQTADPSITDQNFLHQFRACGCYLIDLCASPVDKLDRTARRAACVAGEAVLSRRIRRLQPEVIVCLVRSIRANVAQAASDAGWRGRILDVSYPGRWVRYREAFVGDLLPYANAVLRGEKLQ